MIIRQTKDTLSQIYLDALALRKEVFVDEQKVPVELEIDQDEAHAIHFVLYEASQPIATARILEKANGVAKLQRMAVKKTARGTGNGALLIKEIEKRCEELAFTRIELGAQVTAEGFYRALGFKPFGDYFQDAGIKHIAMQNVLME